MSMVTITEAPPEDQEPPPEPDGISRRWQVVDARVP